MQLFSTTTQYSLRKKQRLRIIFNLTSAGILTNNHPYFPSFITFNLMVIGGRTEVVTNEDVLSLSPSANDKKRPLFGATEKKRMSK